MPQYRIEISPNKRAGCHDTVCKKEAVKIQKGEIRFGSWVEIQEHGSWSWKHWGCVSGAQIAGLQELCGGDPDNYDFDAIDGYDELDDNEVKEKIQRCIKQGHIDPEDFNGDPEKNKLGEKGIHLTAKQKAAKEKAATEAADADEAPAGKASKRSRKKAANDDDDEPKTKKARKSKNVEADEEEPKAKSKTKGKSVGEGDAKESTATKSGRSRKSLSKQEQKVDGEATEEEAEEPATTQKLAKRGPKAKPVKSEEETVDDDDNQEKAGVAPVKAARGRKPSASKGRTEIGTPEEDEGDEKAALASATRQRKRASVSKSEDKNEEITKAAAKRGRKSSVPAAKAAPEPAQGAEDEEVKTAPKAKGRGRPRKSDVAAN
ncbi:uncharacterized protein TrAFT101_010288 [Trichoderma asperellum]|uniref:uncharacterized protein n=1 Tax=Trichoderma asperellum TaxID=101201 RepID=UPI003328D08A|nr:hypothetical protein TrAFT101_010288 [Trichoderma asperellum]